MVNNCLCSFSGTIAASLGVRSGATMTSGGSFIDDQQLVLAGVDNCVHLWDFRQAQKLKVFKGWLSELKITFWIMAIENSC